MLIFLLVMIFIGKFGSAAEGTEDFDELEEIRGPDAGSSGIEDIQADLEKIAEDDAEYENSTLKGSLVLNSS
jgi:hypothetical protein